MARRRKNRTHLKGGTASAPGTAEGVPKSFVIKHGQVGSSLAQLVRDMRKVMEPNTATRLRVSYVLMHSSAVLNMFASEGTGQEQAKGFHDYGSYVRRHASTRVHANRRRAFVADSASVCRSDVELQAGEV